MSIVPETRTAAVRAAIETDLQHGAVVPPLHLSSNFTFAEFARKRRYDYTRTGNPTRDALGDAIAGLESGAGAVVTSSGMAAVNLVLQLLEPGDLLLAPHDCYGGTFRLLSRLAAKGHFRIEFVDQGDKQALRTASGKNPRIILVETPSNPLLRVVDIRYVCGIARSCGALVAVDNTFLSPALQQPLALGADLVIHSTTKYLNGHSDVIGGAVVAASPELHENLAWWANCLGITGAPFDAYMTLRGVRTLHARMEQHERNALVLADLLAAHDAVERVHYPGLASHPGHAIARRQQRGFGGMLSFDLKGGEAAVKAFLEGLSLFSLAESLGGVESLVCHPATMTHAALGPAELARAEIGPNLVRLSVGIESDEDLANDLLQALESAQRYASYPALSAVRE